MSMQSPSKRKASSTSLGSSLKRNKRTRDTLPSAHPNSVQPLGNFYFSDKTHDIRTQGLGLLALLNDDILMDLFELFESFDLAQIAATSKIFYLFASVDMLWKPICIAEFKGNFQYQGTWKKTYVYKKYNLLPETYPPIKAPGLFSDRLYQSWYCAQVDPYMWAKKDNIERRSNLSVEEFVREYEIPNKPVIVTDVVSEWSASSWTREYLLQKYGDTLFKTDYEQTEMKLADYLQYCEKVTEERPIYLFDNSFGEKAPSMLSQFKIPKYFQQDFFDLLNDRPQDRPSFRWLLVGPPRAGATFHKDPNFTSAWHGLIIGKKKWILYPPHFNPCGVFPSPDGQEVTAPMTMVQWFMDFYDQKTPVKPIECTLNAGELIFIPSAWWHSVLNLEESVAITQNYVGKYNLKNVYNFLKEKKNKMLFNLFSSKMEQHHPDLVMDLKKQNSSENSMTWDDFVGDTESDANWTITF